MKNKERFFGLHFDFHANNEFEIGTRTNAEDIEWFIEQAKPDFIQCDCKGHSGNSSYPTKIGHAAEKLKSDNLRVWCDTVKKHNLPIYVHYSGVIDKWYTEHNPDNAVWDKDGNPDETISLFGDYPEKYMIPQLKELIAEYDIDGAWIDGDEWAVKHDYSPNAKPYFTEDMDISERDKITRETFYKYVKTYVDELHKFNSDFKITSNWIYTSQAPDKPEVDIDFISGDIDDTKNSVYAARFETRCIANQGKPWDLMTWGFSYEPQGYCNFADKSTVQLMQEAAMVLSMGGGFQVYIRQNKDGSAPFARSDKYRNLSEFVRARYINFGKKAKAQAAVYYSAQSGYAEKRDDDVIRFKPENKKLRGITDCVLDAQYTCAIVLQHQWESFQDYEMIIVPEWKHLTDTEIERLTDYAKRGGKLVVTGPNLAVKVGGLDSSQIHPNIDFCILGKDGNFLRIFQKDFIDLGEGNGTVYSNADIRDAAFSGWRTDALEEGSITYIPFNLGEMYYSSRSYILTDYMQSILNSIALPHIKLNKKSIDITVQENGNCTFINLINMRQGRHSLEYNIYDEVPEVLNVEITIDKEYTGVKMPLGEEFEYKVCGGKTVIKLKKLEIHSIIELE